MDYRKKKVEINRSLKIIMHCISPSTSLLIYFCDSLSISITSHHFIIDSELCSSRGMVACQVALCNIRTDNIKPQLGPIEVTQSEVVRSCFLPWYDEV